MMKVLYISTTINTMAQFSYTRFKTVRNLPSASARMLLENQRSLAIPHYGGPENFRKHSCKSAQCGAFLATILTENV